MSGRSLAGDRTPTTARGRRRLARAGSGSTSAAPDVLTRCSPDEFARARHGRDALLVAARRLVAVLDGERSGCAVGEGDVEGGGWAARSGPERRALAQRLAGIDGGADDLLGHGRDDGRDDGAEVAGVDDGGFDAVEAFDRALAGAVDAVRRCRQTEHGAGRCWFSPSAQVDGCAEVLRAAHRFS